MNNFFFNTIKSFLFFFLIVGVVAAEPKYVQISDFKQTESDKIIVYEFFWYGCPHCFNIEPTMNSVESNLQKDTILVKVPVALRDTWMTHAKAYYALKQMKIDDDLHDKLFNEIHINGQRLDTKDSLAQFVKNNGYDETKFKKTFDSFGTEIRVKKAMRIAKSYQITSVPTIVVNGKYKTSGSFVSSYEELIDVINLLIQKERVN